MTIGLSKTFWHTLFSSFSFPCLRSVPFTFVDMPCTYLAMSCILWKLHKRKECESELSLSYSFPCRKGPMWLLYSRKFCVCCRTKQVLFFLSLLKLSVPQFGNQTLDFLKKILYVMMTDCFLYYTLSLYIYLKTETSMGEVELRRSFCFLQNWSNIL